MLCIPCVAARGFKTWIFWVLRSDLIPEAAILGGAATGGGESGSVLMTTPGGRGYFFSSFLRFAAFCSGVKAPASRLR